MSTAFVNTLKKNIARPSLHSIVSPVASLLARAQRRGVRRIFYDDGLWIHDTTRGFFAYHQPYLRLDLARFHALTHHNFFWGYSPHPGDTILDVGAGAGEETLTFSRAVGPTGRVISIEAHPRTFRCLEKLVFYNHLTNVTALHRAIADPSCSLIAISDSDEYLANRIEPATAITPAATTYHEPQPVTRGASLTNPDSLSAPSAIQDTLGGSFTVPASHHTATTVPPTTAKPAFSVPATTLDALYHDLRLNNIHFLKMNIEGAERLAIQGMDATLRHTAIVCISCHDFLANSHRANSARTKTAGADFTRPNSAPANPRASGALANSAAADSLHGDDSLRTKSIVREYLLNRGFSLAARSSPGLAPYLYDQVWAFNAQLLSQLAS